MTTSPQRVRLVSYFLLVFYCIYIQKEYKQTNGEIKCNSLYNITRETSYSKFRLIKTIPSSLGIVCV